MEVSRKTDGGASSHIIRVPSARGVACRWQVESDLASCSGLEDAAVGSSAVSHTTLILVTLMLQRNRFREFVFDALGSHGFEQLSVPQQHYYAVFAYDAEVNHGGHAQYFVNSPGDHRRGYRPLWQSTQILEEGNQSGYSCECNRIGRQPAVL